MRNITIPFLILLVFFSILLYIWGDSATNLFLTDCILKMNIVMDIHISISHISRRGGIIELVNKLSSSCSIYLVRRKAKRQTKILIYETIMNTAIVSKDRKPLIFLSNRNVSQNPRNRIRVLMIQDECITVSFILLYYTQIL